MTPESREKDHGTRETISITARLRPHGTAAVTSGAELSGPLPCSTVPAIKKSPRISVFTRFSGVYSAQPGWCPPHCTALMCGLLWSLGAKKDADSCRRHFHPRYYCKERIILGYKRFARGIKRRESGFPKRSKGFVISTRFQRSIS